MDLVSRFRHMRHCPNNLKKQLSRGFEGIASTAGHIFQIGSICFEVPELGSRPFEPSRFSSEKWLLSKISSLSSHWFVFSYAIENIRQNPQDIQIYRMSNKSKSCCQ
jgi:hypothetical protein